MNRIESYAKAAAITLISALAVPQALWAAMSLGAIG